MFANFNSHSAPANGSAAASLVNHSSTQSSEEIVPLTSLIEKQSAFNSTQSPPWLFARSLSQQTRNSMNRITRMNKRRTSRAKSQICQRTMIESSSWNRSTETRKLFTVKVFARTTVNLNRDWQRTKELLLEDGAEWGGFVSSSGSGRGSSRGGGQRGCWYDNWTRGGTLRVGLGLQREVTLKISKTLKSTTSTATISLILHDVDESYIKPTWNTRDLFLNDVSDLLFESSWTVFVHKTAPAFSDDESSMQIINGSDFH